MNRRTFNKVVQSPDVTKLFDLRGDWVKTRRLLRKAGLRFKSLPTLPKDGPFVI